ncbi:Retrovirus-related Pol polyprotein from transposon TNT 1-94 [Eumeta japonica]|uniref:Retrovirus-related Pol polyprotein from transposon TNT 1-94 n=1 Tax=Eumeta variegata TaxID=151549 RepID=A0A4C1URA3_EUMVA|nr:Retrovirus-related Pol polyprotein from transposon TNT 1-94 [Eumeta japonica]
MSECNPVKTPGEIQKKKTNYLINKEEIDNRFYREVIGALMYLVVGTRPDIANTVSRLAQFVNEPCQQDWLAVKRILRTQDAKIQDVLHVLEDCDMFLRQRAALETEIVVQVVRRNLPEIMEDITKREKFLNFCSMVVDHCNRMNK